MAKFGTRSTEKLNEAEQPLVDVLTLAITIIDFTILDAHRGKIRQDHYYSTGRSKTKWPFGKHNALPSKAVDFAPWPIEWPDFKELKAKVDAGDLEAIQTYTKVVARFYAVGAVIRTCGEILKIPVRWGGDWDGDWDFSDQTFDDLGHVELLNG